MIVQDPLTIFRPPPNQLSHLAHASHTTIILPILAQPPVLHSQTLIAPEVRPDPAWVDPEDHVLSNLGDVYEHMPFVDTAADSRPCTNGVIKIGNIPYGTTENEVSLLLAAAPALLLSPRIYCSVGLILTSTFFPTSTIDTAMAPHTMASTTRLPPHHTPLKRGGSFHCHRCSLHCLVSHRIRRHQTFLPTSHLSNSIILCRLLPNLHYVKMSEDSRITELLERVTKTNFGHQQDRQTRQRGEAALRPGANHGGVDTERTDVTSIRQHIPRLRPIPGVELSGIQAGDKDTSPPPWPMTKQRPRKRLPGQPKAPR